MNRTHVSAGVPGVCGCCVITAALHELRLYTSPALEPPAGAYRRLQALWRPEGGEACPRRRCACEPPGAHAVWRGRGRRVRVDGGKAQRAPPQKPAAPPQPTPTLRPVSAAQQSALFCPPSFENDEEDCPC